MARITGIPVGEAIAGVEDFQGLSKLFHAMPVKRLREVATAAGLGARVPGPAKRWARKSAVVVCLLRWVRVSAIDAAAAADDSLPAPADPEEPEGPGPAPGGTPGFPVIPGAKMRSIIDRKTGRIAADGGPPVAVTMDAKDALHKNVELALHVLSVDAVDLVAALKKPIGHRAAAGKKIESISLLAVRVGAAIQTKMLPAQRSRALGKVLNAMQRLEDNETIGIFEGEVAVDMDGVESIPVPTMRTFLAAASKSERARLPAAPIRALRCFTHYFIEVSLRQAIEQSRELDRQRVTADAIAQ